MQEDLRNRFTNEYRLIIRDILYNIHELYEQSVLLYLGEDSKKNSREAAEQI